MVSESVDIKRDYATTFVLAIVLFVLMVASGIVLTAGGGLKDASFVQRFVLYSIFGATGLLFIVIINANNYFTHHRRLKTIVHDPEESVFHGMKIVSNPLLLVLLTIVVFLVPLYLLGKVSNTFFSSIPLVFQSVLGSSASLSLASIFSVAVFPALAENLFIFVILALLYSWNYNKLYKNYRGGFYFVNLIVFPVLFAFLWLVFHLGVYGSSASAQNFVFVFGFLGILFSMLTMSILPWIIIHFISNLMLALKQAGFMASDSTLVWVVIIEVLCFVLLVLFYRLDKKSYK